MSKKDVFGDEFSTKEDSQDFASMFEQSLSGADKRWRVGDKFKGEIISIGKESAYVATGTPADGLIPSIQLKDEKGELKYKIGDFIEVVVLKFKDGELRVALVDATRASGDVDDLEDACDMEIPVEGKVLESVNGGFRVQVQAVKAFCPLSQMDYKVTDPNLYVGKKFEFIVTKYEDRGRNIVVSRRKLLDLQKAEKEGVFLQKAGVGDILEGTVTRIEKFGAFLMLDDGAEGLIHISELSWSRLQSPQDVVNVGDRLRVKVLQIEEVDGRLKISLSLKQGGAEADPWTLVTQNFPVGAVVKAKVDKRENFGLFMTLGPGISGLLPKSKWRDSAEASQYENKKKGDEFFVRVDQVDLNTKKISLGLPTEDEDPAWKEYSNSNARSTGFGSLGSVFSQIKIQTKK